MNQPELSLEANLELIDQICGFVCRRHALHGADAEDFTSHVKLKLLEDGGARLRQFQGRSSLKTFLTSVVGNLFRDYRIQAWGRWRPSAEAGRRGRLAIQLEELLYRDRLSLDEATETLRTNFQLRATPAELAKLAAKLPKRSPRRFESDEQLAETASADRSDEPVRDQEKRRTVHEAREALRDALASRSAEDRLVLRLHYDDGLSLTHIAEDLGIPRRQIYSRLEKLRLELRRALEATGLRASEVLAALGWDDPWEGRPAETAVESAADVRLKKQREGRGPRAPAEER